MKTFTVTLQPTALVPPEYEWKDSFDGEQVLLKLVPAGLEGQFGIGFSLSREGAKKGSGKPEAFFRRGFVGREIVMTADELDEQGVEEGRPYFVYLWQLVDGEETVRAIINFYRKPAARLRPFPESSLEGAIPPLPGPDPVAPTFTSANPGTQSWIAGVSSFRTFTASGVPVVTFSAVGLPDGVTLSGDGVLSIAPTAESEGSVTVTASNGVAPTATQTFVFTVAAGIPDEVVSHGTNENATRPVTDGKTIWIGPLYPTNFNVALDELDLTTFPAEVSAPLATAGDGSVTVPVVQYAFADGYRVRAGDIVREYTPAQIVEQSGIVTISGLANGVPALVFVSIWLDIPAVTIRRDGQYITGPLRNYQPFGPSASVTPQAEAAAPGAPTNLTATSGDGQASIAWDEPADDGGSPVNGYQLAGRNGTTDEFITIVANQPGRSYVETGLTNGILRNWVVYALNDVGQSFASNVASATPVGADTAPTNNVLPTVSGLSQEGSVLTANSNGEWSGTEPITFSRRWQRGTVGSTTATSIPDETGLTYTTTAADIGFGIRTRIDATNSAGTAFALSEYTEVTSASATPIAPSVDIPGSWSISASSGGSRTATWTYSTFKGNPTPVVSRSYRLDGASGYAPTTENATMATFTVSDTSTPVIQARETADSSAGTSGTITTDYQVPAATGGSTAVGAPAITTSAIAPQTWLLNEFISPVSFNATGQKINDAEKGLTYYWSISNAPVGISINKFTGLMSGAPGATIATARTVTVTCQGAVAPVATFTFSVNVQALPYFQRAPEAQSYYVGTAIEPIAFRDLVNPAATGTLAFAFVGDKPAGISMSSSGVMSGTPLGDSAGDVTVRVTGFGGAVDQTTFHIRVFPEMTQVNHGTTKSFARPAIGTPVMWTGSVYPDNYDAAKGDQLTLVELASYLTAPNVTGGNEEVSVAVRMAAYMDGWQILVEGREVAEFTRAQLVNNAAIVTGLTAGNALVAERNWTNVPGATGEPMRRFYQPDFSPSTNVMVTSGVVQTAPAFTSAQPATQSWPVGVAITNRTFTASGSPAPTFTSTGKPAGIGLSSAGVLSGTPTSASSGTIVVTAQNGVSPNATQSFAFNVTSASVTYGNAISVDLGNTNTASSVVSMGAIPRAGWVKRSGSPNFTAAALPDNTGAATTMQIVTTGFGGNSASAAVTDGLPEFNILSDGVKPSSGVGTYSGIAMTGIPYAAYDVLVYFDRQNGGSADLSGTTLDASIRLYVGSETRDFQAKPTAGSRYSGATWTKGAAGNYFHFENVTGASRDLLFETTGSAASGNWVIAGFTIVNRT